MRDLPNVPGGTGHPEPLLIDAPTAARQLSISTRTLWKLTNAGEVPCVRLGGRVLYRPESLREAIAAKETRGENGGAHE